MEVFMKTKKIAYLTLSLLTSITLLSACSSNSNQTNNNASSNASQNSTKTIGEYLEESNKEKQLWLQVQNNSEYSIAKDDKVNALVVVENGKLQTYKMYMPSDSNNKETSVSYLAFIDEEFDSVEKRAQIKEIVNSFDTEDGSQDGVIQIGTLQSKEVEHLTIGEVSKMKVNDILETAKHYHYEVEKQAINSSLLEAKAQYVYWQIKYKVATELGENASDYKGDLDEADEKLKELENISEKELKTPKQSNYTLRILTDSTGNSTASQILSYKKYSLGGYEEDEVQFDTSDYFLNSAQIYSSTYAGFIGKKGAFVTSTSGTTFSLDQPNTTLDNIKID